MSDTLLLKRNSTAGTIPAATSLVVGELALNTGDGSLYAKVGSAVQLVQTQVTLYSVLCDFGLTPIQSAVFHAPLATALITNKVLASIGGDVPGSMIDELEMDPLTVFGHVTSAGNLEFLISTVDPTSYIIGKRYINFYVG